MRKRDLLTPRVERKHSGAMYAELSVCMCVWLLVIALVHGGKYTNDSGTFRYDVCGCYHWGGECWIQLKYGRLGVFGAPR